MKKIGVILISVVLLSVSAGCRQSVPSGDELLSHTPTATPGVSINDGIVTFENTTLMNRYTDDAHQLFDGNRTWAEKDYVCLDFFTEELTFEKAEELYIGFLSQETIDACMDWISCLYDTAYYQDREMFRKNVEYRSSYLQENLDLSKILEEHIETLSNIQQTILMQNINDKGYRFFLQCMEYYRDPRQSEIRGLVFSCDFLVTGSSLYDVIPQYYQNQKRSYSNFTSDEEGVFQASLPVYFTVFLNEQNKIIGWRETYKTEENAAAKRCFLATENTVSAREEVRYLPVMVDESFTKYVSFGESDRMKAAQKKAIEAFQYFVKLNKDCPDDYFDGFYELCSPGLKAQLQSAGILEQMLQDAQKYNVTIALDHVSASKAEALSTGFIKGYKDTIYGDVYIIEKYVYMQSGSEEFNQKYALPPDKGNATFRFYISYNEGTPQLVAFRINASSQLSPFENYDQIWAGNWDNG